MATIENLKNEESYVSLNNINKIYPNGFHAVHDFNIEIKKHEFIVFVGPSGCGKSTTLRMIAGLEDISSGDLIIDGERANDLTPKDRDIAMVFQSYALYPHMTVFNNMAYSLKIRHLSKNEIYERVNEAAKILQIEQWLDRKPKELSGGQRQRVALGRAIVRKAKVFLMDEPLSNLDAKLRVQMRSEIVKLHNQLEATTIYVTHDQTEAMTMATRIVIMKDGYVQQIATPSEIYAHPANKFVAGFIGSPAMNFFQVKFDGHQLIFDDGSKLKLTNEFIKNKDLPGEMILGIRPEDIKSVGDETSSTLSSPIGNIEISVAELLGSEYYLHGTFASSEIVMKTDANKIINPGDKVQVCFKLNHMHFFDLKTEKAL